jgi:2-C-methyl-D-erythritol 4-phosphate cytidylyltransferase
MTTYQNNVIIVAGGSGLRMTSEKKKQYLLIDEIPILTHTLKAFDKLGQFDNIILVVPKEDQIYCQSKILDPYSFKHSIQIVPGGKKRQDSVYNGLSYLKGLKIMQDSIILIHDGVRPFITNETIEKSIQGAKQNGACIPVVKLTDTIKEVTRNSFIIKTKDRKHLYSAQTPQAFKFNLLYTAFEHAIKSSFTGTDDASLVEFLGKSVAVYEGSKLNIKITTPDDLILGNYILKTLEFF